MYKPKTVRSREHPFKIERLQANRINLDGVEIKPPTGKKITAPVFKKQRPDEEISQDESIDLERTAELAKQFLQLLEKGKAARPAAEPDELPVEPIGFEIGQAFYLLPQLGAIDHPLLYGTIHAVKIPVASRAWLVCLDQLRTYGWPLSGIDKFLNDSADIVMRDALFDVRSDDASNPNKKINNVEKFSTWWPSPDRQNARIEKNIDKVLDAIRSQYAPENPFRVSNYEAVIAGKEQPKAPPAKVDFTDGDHVWPDILRNFNQTVKKIQGINGLDINYGWECTYQKQRDWVPLEFEIIDPHTKELNIKTRREFEDMYGLTPYLYLSSYAWKLLMFTLLIAEKIITEESIPEEYKDSHDELRTSVQFEQDGHDKHAPARWNITTKLVKQVIVEALTKDGDIPEAEDWVKRNISKVDLKHYRIFLSKIELDHRAQATCQLPDEEKSLREWCDLMKNPNEIYPLLHVMLNVDAPEESAQFKSYKYYQQFIYLAYYNGKYHARLISDAPLKLFRALMIEQYGGKVEQRDSYSKCFKEFSDNVWDAIKRSGHLPGAQEMPGNYRNLLETLYFMGKERKCYDPLKPLSPFNQGVIFSTTPVLTREQVGKFTEDDKRRMALQPASADIKIPGLTWDLEKLSL